LFSSVQLQPHGSVHRAIAGFMGCDLLDEFVESGALQESERVSICQYLDFMTKELYRTYAISPFDDCIYQNQNQLHCGYKCNTRQYFNTRMYLAFEKFQSAAPIENMTDAAMNQWYDWYCTGNGHMYTFADHLESASTADPSFWSIHPTIERTIQLGFISKRYSVFNWESLGKKKICDKFLCYDEHGVYSFDDSCCGILSA
jgi:hypothetical protein